MRCGQCSAPGYESGRGNLLAANDADEEFGGDFGMDADRDARLAERLDGLVEVDAAALDLEALLAEELRDVLRGHGTEELAFLGGLAALLVRQRFDAGTQRLGVT